MSWIDHFAPVGAVARPGDLQRSRSEEWFLPALMLVASLTLFREMLLTLNRTDLFVDEAQYWLWGRSLSFGYFSKPPLIAWLIRAVTEFEGSDAIFWIRMPAAVLHGATALILGALASRIAGRNAAIWTAAAYATLPMVSVGSLLISTDTVMAPFFAGALFFYHRLLSRHRMADAILVGVMLGLACLAKYAGVYFLAGALLAGILDRDLRPRWTEAFAGLGVAAAILAPNLIWNAENGLSTFHQTATNIGWVQESNPLAALDVASLLAFWGSQINVAGPFALAALLVGLRQLRRQPFLGAFALVPLAVVSVQSLLDGAYANWAASAYFGGSVLMATVLAAYPRWQAASLITNGLVALILPVLTLFPTLGPKDDPLLHRYLGRAAVSREIIGLAQRAGGLPIVSDNREVMADLFYTGRDTGLRFFAVPPTGKPKSHYEAAYPLPADMAGRVLLVTAVSPDCAATPHRLNVAGSAYRKQQLAAYEVEATCARYLAPQIQGPR